MGCWRVLDEDLQVYNYFVGDWSANVLNKYKKIE